MVAHTFNPNIEAELLNPRSARATETCLQKSLQETILSQCQKSFSLSLGEVRTMHHLHADQPHYK